MCAVEELCDELEQDSIDSVAVALPSVRHTLIEALLWFAEYAVRPGGLVLVQCPSRAVADVVRIGCEPDDNDEQWMDYKSLLACVGTVGPFPGVACRVGRDARRRQHGLLLLTAHRAKGLEFDHVVVLAGGWDRAGVGENVDAPRRLRYVAMTRARRTLALTCLVFHPAEPDPRRYETRARRGDSRVRATAGCRGVRISRREGC